MSITAGELNVTMPTQSQKEARGWFKSSAFSGAAAVILAQPVRKRPFPEVAKEAVYQFLSNQERVS